MAEGDSGRLSSAEWAIQTAQSTLREINREISALDAKKQEAMDRAKEVRQVLHIALLNKIVAEDHGA